MNTRVTPSFDRQRLFQLRLLDGVLIALSLPLLALVRGNYLQEEYLTLLLLSLVLFEWLAGLHGLYATWRLRPLHVEVRLVSIVWAEVAVGLVLVGFVFKVTALYSRLLISVWLLLVPLMLALVRWALRQRGDNSVGGFSRLVFVGATVTARRMAERFAESSDFGVRVDGVYEDRTVGRVVSTALPLLGKTDELLVAARDGRVDCVYITLPMHAEKRILELVNALADTTASVYVVPDPFIFDMMHATWTEVMGHPVISIYESPFSGPNGVLKRIEDVVLALLILILILPLMLTLVALVKLTSPGPALFRQHRYGLNGEIVEVWKFRSMTVCDDGDVVVQACKGDSRLTRLGAFLRRTSLDELPQFINVLQGGMSIVGPRPHAVAHNEQYRRLIHGYMLRHKVKPGITGWAQINGWRGETDTLDKMKKRVEYDLYYMRNWSLWFDLRIVFLTVFKGFVGKHVY